MVIMHSVSKHVRPRGAHRENLNEDTSILSATKMYSPMTLVCSFWQCKVCADIRGGSLEIGRQSNDSRVIENMDFHGFRRYVLS